jgi:hypothetical protein
VTALYVFGSRGGLAPPDSRPGSRTGGPSVVMADKCAPLVLYHMLDAIDDFLDIVERATPQGSQMIARAA